jgi:ADP-heptose:LPS heptosyltransferase
MIKVDVMRQIDRWVGVPLCLLVTWLEKFLVLFKGKRTTPGKKLLIIKLSELGANVVLGDPVRKLRETYQREHIWYMAFAKSQGILEVMDFVPRENLLLISTASLPQFVRDMFRALWRIRRVGVDTALDLEFFSRASALIAWLSGARRRVGIHAYFGEGAYRGELMTHGVKFNPHLHISGMFRALAESVTLPDGELQRIDFIPGPVLPIKDRFIPTDKEQETIRKLLINCGWKEGQTVVLLNANTSDRELIPLRRWDEGKYAEIARLILSEFPDSLVLLTGSPKEAKGIGRLEQMVGLSQCRSVAGKTSFRELLTLYSFSKLMVTNDSGPAHFAALTDMAVVVLFGPETPQLWMPIGKKVRTVYRGLACSPCFSIYNGRQSGCRKNVCMEMTPDEVFAEVKIVLSEPV